MVQKSFLKTGIAKALDASEDDHLWEQETKSDEDCEEVEDLPP